MVFCIIWQKESSGSILIQCGLSASNVAESVKHNAVGKQSYSMIYITTIKKRIPKEMLI